VIYKHSSYQKVNYQYALKTLFWSFIMAAVDVETDLLPLVDVVASGSLDQIIATARSYLQRDSTVDILIGHIGMIAAHGDPIGHRTITLAAASMLSRFVSWIPASIDTLEPTKERALPLFVQALKVAMPILRAGREAQLHVVYPHPLFPSELIDSHKTVNDVMREAIERDDALLAERALLGLYGTGADYRTMQARAYESISTTFQDGGHPLMFTVRGFQLLDAVEWGDRVPNIIHWLAPHLPLHPGNDEPDWIKTVRAYTKEPAHSVTGIRTRLSAPKDENALSLRELILSEANTTQVCQGVYNALINGEASPQGIASVIALTAAEIIQRVGDEDQDLFLRAAHGLLFAAAARLVFRQIQDVEVLNLLFTSAAYIHALQKEIPVQQQQAISKMSTAGGGLIAASQLETLSSQLAAYDLQGAHATAQRYLKIGHDARALFGTIGLMAARIDTESVQGHNLQLVQAAAETFLTWPKTLANIDIDILLQVTLRAALFGERDKIVSSL
jgi:hypothetical protein